MVVEGTREGDRARKGGSETYRGGEADFSVFEKGIIGGSYRGNKDTSIPCNQKNEQTSGEAENITQFSQSAAVRGIRGGAAL